MENYSHKLTVGNDSVVIGDVTGNVGNGSVVIGATDNRGNTILNTPMAVGRGAFAGHGSIAIGAGAGSGASLPFIVNQLRDAITTRVNDPQLIEQLEKLIAELEAKDRPVRKDLIRRIIDTVDTANSTIATIDSLRPIINSILTFLG
jgi:hypothetical protein